MQKYISALVLFLLGMPVAVFAVSLQGFDIALPNGLTITSAGASSADTVTINSDSVSFGLVTGNSIHLTSSSRYKLDNNQNAATGCSSTQSTLDYQLPNGTASATLTVTPSATTCTTAGGGGTSGGGGGGGVALAGSPNSGGGGGGGGSATPPPLPQVTTPAVMVASPVVQQTPAVLVSPVFSANLRSGARNNEVTRLQTLLGQDSALYPEKTVSGYFGPKTAAAVKRFQKKYHIPQTGTVGPRTRVKLNEVFGTGAVPAIPATPASSGTSATPATPATPAQPGVNAAQASQLQALIQSLQSQLNALQQRQSPVPAPAPGGTTSGKCNTVLNSNLICLP